jgi:hypothetical protein
MLLSETEKFICGLIAFVILFIFICFTSFSIVYFESMMKIVMDIVEYIVNSATIILAVVSAVAIVIAYFIAYIRASRFGVPFRYARANIHESIEVILTMVFGLGLGIVAAVFIFTLGIEIKTSQILSSIFVMIGYIIIIMPFALRRLPSKKVFRRVCITLILLAIIIVSLIAGHCMSAIGRNENNFTAIFVMAHLLVITIFYLLWLVDRLVGNHKTELVCKVNELNYLVGLRHSGGAWTLHRCSNGEVEIPDGYKKTIYYECGRYILRKLDDVDNLIVQKTPWISPVVNIESIKQKTRDTGNS